MWKSNCQQTVLWPGFFTAWLLDIFYTFPEKRWRKVQGFSLSLLVGVLNKSPPMSLLATPDCRFSTSPFLQITRLCAEEATAQEQTGQVEECLKANLLKIKQEACKKVNHCSEMGVVFRRNRMKPACRLSFHRRCWTCWRRAKLTFLWTRCSTRPALWISNTTALPSRLAGGDVGWFSFFFFTQCFPSSCSWDRNVCVSTCDRCRDVVPDGGAAG